MNEVNIVMPTKLTSVWLLKTAGSSLPGKRFSKNLNMLNFPHHITNELIKLPAIKVELDLKNKKSADHYLDMVDEIHYNFGIVGEEDSKGYEIYAKVFFNEKAKTFIESKYNICSALIIFDLKSKELVYSGSPLRDNLLLMGNFYDLVPNIDPISPGHESYIAIFGILKSYIEILEANKEAAELKGDLSVLNQWLDGFNNLSKAIIPETTEK